MKGKLNAISLFSGIGGFELALSEYCRTMLYCEKDKHAQAVLLSRMVEGKIDIAPICTDIREIKAEFIDFPIDIIFGGFPCQDISVAGKGIGLEGQRSGLFFEIVRLAKEIKPPFLFLENVPAIRTRGLDRVIKELTEIGYDCRWAMLSASAVGANHKRERWFLLAYSEFTDSRGRTTARHPADQGRETRETRGTCVQPSNGEACADNSESCGKAMAYSNERGLSEKRPEQQTTGITGEGSSISDTNNQGLEGQWRVTLGVEKTHQSPLMSCWWSIEPDVGRVANGVPLRVERIKRLGNAVVPLQAKTAFEYLMGIKK